MSDAANRDVWVIIPCYNEGRLLQVVLDQVVPLGYSIVVVDDGSRPPVAGLTPHPSVRLVRHCVNLGQGAALQTGLDFALERGARYLVTFDSDDQHLASDIAAILQPLRDGRAGAALGTRFGAGGRALNISAPRAALLKAATLFTRQTTGLDITDTHNGLRGFTRDTALRIRITQNRMAHASQLLEEIAHLGVHYTEVPVTIRYTDHSLAKGQRMSNAFNILWESMTEMFSR